MKNRLQNGQAKTSTAKRSPTKTPKLKLEDVLVYSVQIPDEPNALRMDSAGEFWLEDEYSKTPPVKTNVAAALKWFLRCEKFEKDSSGNMAPVIKAMLKQGPMPRLGFVTPGDRDEAEEHAAGKTMKMEIELSPGTYGTICSASVVHGCTPKQALELLLNETDAPNEWSIHSYPVRPWSKYEATTEEAQVAK